MAGIGAVNQNTQYQVRITGMPPQVRLDTVPADFRIDNTQAWKGVGIYTLDAFLSRMAQKGHQKAIEAIGAIASDGNELARIEKHIPDLIVKQAVEDSWEEYDFEFLHNSPALPQVRYTPGFMQLHVELSEVEMVAQPGSGGYDSQGRSQSWSSSGNVMNLLV